MYLGYVPMLSKGSFALYYGGEEIIPQLSDQSGSLVCPAFMGSSLIFQLSFLIFKKINMLELYPNTTNSGMYFNNVFSTLLSGYNNTYTILATIIFTTSGFLFAVVHYSSIEARRGENFNKVESDIKEGENLEKIPFSIHFFAGILFCLNIAQFMRNYALRKFARKKVQEFFQVDLRLAKYRKKSNKIAPFVLDDNDEPTDPGADDEADDLYELTETISRPQKPRALQPEAFSTTETDRKNKILENENDMIAENEKTRYSGIGGTLPPFHKSIGLAEVDI